MSPSKATPAHENDLAQRLKYEFEIAQKGVQEAHHAPPDIEALAAQALEGQRRYEAAIQQRAAVENARRAVADFELTQRALADLRGNIPDYYKHPKHIITNRRR